MSKIDEINHRLVRYANEENDEYIVIVSPGEDQEEWLDPGFSIQESVIIDDASMMPCDRILVARGL